MGDVDLLAVVMSVAAALVFAVSSNVQRGAAAAVPVSHGGPIRLMLTLFTVPRWLIGSFLALIALALHAAALARGGVILVQAILAAGLIAALGVEAARERRRMRPLELLGSVLTVGGVVLVLALGRPGGGREVDFSIQALTGVATLGVFGVGLLASRAHHRVRLSAVVMGAAAGALFALDAVYLKGIATWSSGMAWLPLVTNLAGFVCASMMGNVVVHRGYQRAPLRIVLPAVTAADPLAAFVVGRWLLDERLQGGATANLAVTAGLAAIVVGIVTTTRGAHPIIPPVVTEAGAEPRPGEALPDGFEDGLDGLGRLDEVEPQSDPAP